MSKDRTGRDAQATAKNVRSEVIPLAPSFCSSTCEEYAISINGDEPFGRKCAAHIKDSVGAQALRGWLRKSLGRLVEGEVISERSNLAGVEVEGHDFPKNIEFRGAVLSGAKFVNCTFSGVKFSAWSGKTASEGTPAKIFENVQFIDSTLRNATFRLAFARAITFKSSQLLNGAFLGRTEAKDWKLTDVEFSRTSFDDLSLVHSEFKRVSFVDSSFRALEIGDVSYNAVRLHAADIPVENFRVVGPLVFEGECTFPEPLQPVIIAAKDVTGIGFTRYFPYPLRRIEEIEDEFVRGIRNNRFRENSRAAGRVFATSGSAALSAILASAIFGFNPAVIASAAVAVSLVTESIALRSSS